MILWNVWVDLGKSDHVKEAPPPETTSKLFGQFFRQCRDNFLSIFGTLVVEDFCLNALTDTPVEQSHAGIDRLSHTFAGLLDHAAHVGRQTFVALDDVDVLLTHCLLGSLIKVRLASVDSCSVVRLWFLHERFG